MIESLENEHARFIRGLLLAMCVSVLWWAAMAYFAYLLFIAA